MVRITSFVGAVALLSTFAHGLPRPQIQGDDSAIGIEVGVSAPNGIPITDTAELESQRAREAGSTAPIVLSTSAPAPVVTKYGGNYNQPKESIALSTAIVTSSHVLQTQVLSTHVLSTSTSTSHVVYSTPSYGSGKSNWDNSAYQDCVQQCVAQHSAPAATYKPTATAHETPGRGATHTVIVAPTQGVLRYIPFAVNASVGDTIKFMWGANNHTVTKGSALLPCNRSGDNVFASGTKDKDFVFTQVVNDTTPTYFFCGTATHCQKGMFGIINPVTNFASPSSVSSNIQSIAANSSNVMGYLSYTQKNTQNNAAAAKWGGNIDLSAFPDWAAPFVAENVLYTRNFLAANPETLKEDGSVDLSTGTTTPLSIPQDLAAALNNAGSGAASSTAAPTVAPPAATTSASTASTETAGTTSNLNNGAGSLSSSKMLVAGVAAVATFFLL